MLLQETYSKGQIFPNGYLISPMQMRSLWQGKTHLQDAATLMKFLHNLKKGWGLIMKVKEAPLVFFCLDVAGGKSYNGRAVSWGWRKRGDLRDAQGEQHTKMVKMYSFGIFSLTWFWSASGDLQPDGELQAGGRKWLEDGGGHGQQALEDHSQGWTRNTR